MTSSKSISLDTHSIIWYLTANKSLSQEAKSAIDAIFESKKIGLISMIVIFEIYYLCLKNKKLDFGQIIEYIGVPNINIIPINLDIAKISFDLPIELEMHDRIIVATAILYKSPLVSRDKIIKKSKSVDIIW